MEYSLYHQLNSVYCTSLFQSVNAQVIYHQTIKFLNGTKSIHFFSFFTLKALDTPVKSPSLTGRGFILVFKICIFWTQIKLLSSASFFPRIFILQLLKASNIPLVAIHFPVCSHRVNWQKTAINYSGLWFLFSD